MYSINTVLQASIQFPEYLYISVYFFSSNVHVNIYIYIKICFFVIRSNFDMYTYILCMGQHIKHLFKSQTTATVVRRSQYRSQIIVLTFLGGGGGGYEYCQYKVGCLDCWERCASITCK